MAEKTAIEALEVAERCGAKFFGGWDHLVLGEAAIEKEVSQAAPHLEKCVTIFTEIKAENFLAKTYAAYGRLYKKKGDIAKAREYFTKALDIFNRLGTLIDPDKVKEELASLPPDKE
jgi:tetratricopeptide (TPR) repeat protein